jgi:putative membrane protein
VYPFILGLVIASTVLILVPNPYATEAIRYENVTFITVLLSVLLFIAGVLLRFWMSKLEEKYK